MNPRRVTLFCFWIWEVAAFRIGKVLPTDSAIRKGIMEKLRSECEARGEHLPEVPSFQVEMWAGCRFLMESQFLLGAGPGKIGGSCTTVGGNCETLIFGPQNFNRNGVYCLKPCGLSTQRPKGWTLKNHGRFFHRSAVCMENVRFSICFIRSCFSPNAMGMAHDGT